MKRALILITLLLLVLLEQHVFALAGESPFFIAHHGDYLTVRAIDVPLLRVVQEIARQMDIMNIKVYGEPRGGDEKITVEFYDLPVSEGFAKMLAGHNAVYVYSPLSPLSKGGKGKEDPAPQRLAEVWVFFQGKKGGGAERAGSESGAGVMPLFSKENNERESPDPSIGSAGRSAGGSAGRIQYDYDEGGAQAPAESSGKAQNQGDIAVLMNLLKDADPTVRLSAIETLSELSSQVPAKDVADVALKDEDPRIRLAILTSTLALPAEMVMYHALRDPVPQVRVAALEALRWGIDTKDKVRGVVEQAVNDPNAVVQATAEEILKVMLEIEG